MKKKIFITGKPRVGKTTLVKKILSSLPGVRVEGFYTEEVREGGRRVGFILKTTSGESFPLASLSGASPYRVGRYRVFLDGLDEVVRRMEESRGEADLLVIDEVGKMECFSETFVKFVRALLESEETVLLGTVALKGSGLIEEVKGHPSVDLVTLTEENREAVSGTLLPRLRRLLEGKGSISS
ncbi:MAG: NTPase [Deltaproteobacteria bacterium]|nr:MAG: NTPase [Deltaproteobacteria bacterium]